MQLRSSKPSCNWEFFPSPPKSKYINNLKGLKRCKDLDQASKGIRSFRETSALAVNNNE